jgi:hypothetical protein
MAQWALDEVLSGSIEAGQQKGFDYITVVHRRGKRDVNGK